MTRAPLTPPERTALVLEEAARAGFHRAGVAPALPWPRHGAFVDFLVKGHAGAMDYLAQSAEARRDPRTIQPSARAIVTVGLSYAHPDAPPAPDGAPRGFVARYARGEDYHTIVQRKLRSLAARLAERLTTLEGRAPEWTACVDTMPLLEREAGARGGVGFLGKNTLLIAPGLGSYLVLGELLLDVECEPTAAEEPRCGRCRACLDACPTGAFVDEYQLDARRCIAYLTIENPGAIPRELRPLVENMVFGCDRCQEVCPWNAAGPDGERPVDPLLRPSPRRHAPELVALLGLGAAQFRKLVRGSALRRVHRAQLLRNVAVALGNVGGAGEIEPLAAALREPSPLVREHVAWALSRIAERLGGAARTTALAALAAHLADEPDPGARAEIERALGRP